MVDRLDKDYRYRYIDKSTGWKRAIVKINVEWVMPTRQEINVKWKLNTLTGWEKWYEEKHYFVRGI